MIIVGISGKRRTGKTTVAEHLTKFYGFQHYSLAESLKEMVRQKYYLTVEQTDGLFKESFDSAIQMTPRELMCQFGRDKRKQDPNFWIKRLSEKMLLHPKAQMQKAVISDIRFKNEAEWVKKHGGYLIRLNRDEQYTGENLLDPSETDLDDYPHFDLTFSKDVNKSLEDIAAISLSINSIARVHYAKAA